MDANSSPVIQGTALALLGMVLVWLGRLLERLATRLATAHDKMAETLEKMSEHVVKLDIETERRHAATRELIMQVGQMNRHSFNNALQRLALVVDPGRKFHTLDEEK